jgi:hypothetical protein
MSLDSELSTYLNCVNTQIIIIIIISSSSSSSSSGSSILLTAAVEVGIPFGQTVIVT